MSAKIISMINQKGGCGKTTVTMHLGGAMGLFGLKVLIVDLDGQESSNSWYGQAKSQGGGFLADIADLRNAPENFVDVLDQKRDSYDVILLDCPPSIQSKVAWNAAVVSDLVVVPVIPDTLHVWACKRVEELLRSARLSRERNPDLAPFQSRLVVTMMENTRLAKKSLVDFQAVDIQMSKAYLNRRVVYKEAVTLGCCALQLDKGDVARELTDLTKELATLVGIKLKTVKLK